VKEFGEFGLVGELALGISPVWDISR
jgi:hypothetical protein